MGFSLGYPHSHPIPKQAQQKKRKYRPKCKQSTAKQQKTVPQKTGYESLKNENCKKNHSRYFENQTKYFYSHPSKYHVSNGEI